MENLRMLGSSIQKEAELRAMAPKDVAAALHCTERQVLSLYKGRAICSYQQMRTLAELFSTSVGKLLDGDPDYYEENVICCMHRFSCAENREKILDIVYAYLDICDLVSR